MAATLQAGPNGNTNATRHTHRGGELTRTLRLAGSSKKILGFDQLEAFHFRVLVFVYTPKDDLTHRT
jgi:hypothetical protein